MRWAQIEDFEAWMLKAPQGSQITYIEDAKSANIVVVRDSAAYARALQQLGLVELVQRRVSPAPGTFDYIAVRTKKRSTPELADRAKIAAMEERSHA